MGLRKERRTQIHFQANADDRLSFSCTVAPVQAYCLYLTLIETHTQTYIETRGPHLSAWMMISDGVNCFSAVPAVSQCAPSGCNRNILITVGIIVIVIGCAAGSCHSHQCGRLQGKCEMPAWTFFLMCDCARKGIWFVLLDRHVYLTVQTYIHLYIGSYIHRQFVLIAF